MTLETPHKLPALGQIVGEPGHYFICIDPDVTPQVFVGPFAAPVDATELVGFSRKVKAAAKVVAKVAP